MNLANAKVLVVEDDPLMRTFTVNTLNRMGVTNVQEAADGSEGLKKATSFLPDVIVTDIHMQPMNGLEFVQRLRSAPHPALGNIKVILMSADSSPGTLNSAVPLGVSAYVLKPPRLSELKNKLESALNGG